MKDVKGILKKNAVRISFSLVIIFTITTIVWTARFVIFYSTMKNIDPGESLRRPNELNMELFDAITENKKTKTRPKPVLPADIRDPFSPPYAPPPLEVTTADEVEDPPPSEE